MKALASLVAVFALLMAVAVSAQEPYYHNHTDAELASLRALIPQVGDTEVAKILADPRLVFFVDGDIPDAIQSFNNVHAGVFSPQFDLSGGADRFGKANARREFPWEFPFGTQLSPHGGDKPGGIQSFRALWLPLKPDGTPWPAVYWRAQLRRTDAETGAHPAGYRWIYPAGTRVFEFVSMRGPDGYDYVWSVRMRSKEVGSESHVWGVDVFVPVHTPEDLVKKIEQRIHPDDWDTELSRAVTTIRDGSNLQWGRGFKNRHTRKQIVNELTAMDYLPRLGKHHDALVASILRDEPFESALGNTWRKIRNKEVAKATLDPVQPTTQEKFHVVPYLYRGGYVEYERESCARCHDTANTDVNFYDFLARDWYGQVPGGDTIFTIHPFDPATISTNGGNITPRIRQDFLRAGIFDAYDPTRHPSTRYRIVNTLE